MARFNNWTDVSAGNSAHLMSPAWTFNKVTYGYSTGSSFIGNYQAIQSYGAASMSVMPYSVSDFPSWGPSTAWREAFTHPSINYTLLLTTDNSSTAAIQNLVWHGTPVNFAMHDDILRTAAVNSGQKAVLASSDYTFTGGYHAQTIVGYDNDTMLGNETGAFKVVNSWGTNFGQKGFYWITYACMNKILQAERYAYYISDIHERNTSLMASMHFDAPPATRYGSALDVGVVSNHVTESETYSLGYIDNHLPSYMCLDVSNLVWDPKATANNCTLTFHDLAGDGSIASAHIEGYDHGYSIRGPDELSEQPSGLPASTGTPLTVNLAKYPPQTVDNILNISGSQFSTGGFEHWLSIPDGPNGTYAVRSGDLVDSQDSWLSAAVTGPAQLQFQWKVSSQPGHDLLTFSVDGTTVNTTSGETGWTNVTYSLASGLHQLQWRYAKDAATLQGGDCGWLSSLGPPASSANDTTPPNTNNNTNNATPPEANNSTNQTPPPEPPPPTNGTTEGNNTTMAAIGLGARVGRAAPSSIGVLELRTAERR